MSRPAVIGILCDGLRPDCVREAWMPRLTALGREGVRFLSHRSVFPTSTRVCTASLVTGVYPRAHGLAGNVVFARALARPRAISTRDHKALIAWERALGGRLLRRRTFFQMLGGSCVILSAVSPGSAYIWNARKSAALLHPDLHWPSGFRSRAESACGAVPAAASPDLERCAYMLDLAAGYVLPKMKPRALIIHLSEPDSLQHAIGVDGPLHRKTLRGLDRLIGEFLDRLNGTGTGQANVLVMSDHGMSSACGMVDLEGEIRAAGVGGMGRDWAVAHSEGAALFYALRGGIRTFAPIAEFLRNRPWAGPLFSRGRGGPEGRIPGSFSLGLAGCGGARGPDMLMAFQWEDKGRGLCYSSVNNKGSGGTHGSCAPFELANLCIASGPAFKKKKEIRRPSGNIDIAPTILSLLGRAAPGGMAGRPLWEGMRGARAPAEKFRTETFRVEGRSESGAFLQTLQRTRAGHTRAGDRIFLDFAKLERS